MDLYQEASKLVCVETGGQTDGCRLSSLCWTRTHILHGVCHASFNEWHNSWQNYNTLCKEILS